jgi:NAD(P)-dependent dehydrogenase (short-subunit alcohol dehydrogenase family)
MDQTRVDEARHAGRRAIVTGAGSGIGRATALRLAREGADVIGCDVDAEGLQRTEQELRIWDVKIEIVTCDITSQTDVDVMVATTLRDDRIDILANVAGILDSFEPVGDVTDEAWDRSLAVNLTGPMRLCRAIVPIMQRQGGGAVVNVASIGGLNGGTAGVAYTAAKHGVVGLTQSVAYLYGPAGVRCNAVCPGGVDTPLSRASQPRSEWAFARLRKSMARSTRLADPDEIAALISWLSSDEAVNVNGAVITADAGWTAG